MTTTCLSSSALMLPQNTALPSLALKTGLNGFSEKLTPSSSFSQNAFSRSVTSDGCQVELGERHRRRFPEHIEHGRLAGLAQFPFTLGQRKDAGDAIEQRAAFLQAVQRARFDQALHDAPVDRLQVGAAAEVFDGLKGAVFIALLDYRLDGAAADIFNRRPARSGWPVWPEPLFSMEKVQLAAVDIRRQNFDIQAAALGDSPGDFLQISGMNR